MKKWIAILLTALLLAGCAAGAPTSISVPDSQPVQTTAPGTDVSVPPVQTLPEPTEAEDAITVSTVDEFLAAIGPDREIVLQAGYYDLSDAKDYGRLGTEYYSWEESFDGPELVISQVQNLRIRAEGFVILSARPRYANVMTLRGCTGLALEGLVLGHTVEQGFCTGGVVNLERSTDIHIDSCRLYGCGTVGVIADGCRDVMVTDTEIYECSYGAVELTGCRNVCFDSCYIHDVDFYDLFSIRASFNVGIINSQITRNSGNGYDTMFSVQNSRVYLGGLRIQENQTETVFAVMQDNVTVEKCDFRSDFRVFCDAWNPLMPDGRPLTEGELLKMSCGTVTWAPVTDPEPSAAPDTLPTEAPQVGENGVISVSTVDQLLAAIRPGAVISLAPGTYYLSSAANYGGSGTDYYLWEDTFDGPELQIVDCDSLTILGGGQATICAAPRYANVLSFFGCDDLTLEGFVMGHSEQPGYCSGGVLKLFGGSHIRVRNCSLYGCGILGVEAERVSDLRLDECEIYECSDGACWFYSCADVILSGCSIHDNGSATFFVDDGCTGMVIDNAPLTSTYEEWPW